MQKPLVLEAGSALFPLEHAVIGALQGFAATQGTLSSRIAGHAGSLRGKSSSSDAAPKPPLRMPMLPPRSPNRRAHPLTPSSSLSQALRDHQIYQGAGLRGFAAQVDPSQNSSSSAAQPTAAWTEAKAKKTTLQPPSTPSLSERLSMAKDATIGAGRAVVAFFASVPSRFQRLMSMTGEERRAALKKAWIATKEVLHHFWVGSKLLWADVKISSRLTAKILNGKELTRREKRQLTRTAADLFRLVPMIVILVVPFLEFALPILLKVFPNMLPSTFEDKLKKEEELKKRLGAKLEMAKFLQDTISEMAGDIVANQKGRNQASAAELVEFINKVRAGQAVSNNEILRFTPLFNDELTLDNLDRVHLISMCRFVGIQPFGTDAFLRTRIRSHIRQLKEDDREIQREGLGALSDPELREACRARAMRAPYGPHAREFMEQQMKDWLDLSLGHALPSSLLLMSRAMTISQMGPVREKDKIFGGLVDTIQTLPDEVVETVESDAAAKGAVLEPGQSDRAQRSAQMAAKLELIQQEEEAIREEEEELKERAAGMGSQGAAEAEAAARAQQGREEAAARAIFRAAAINVVSGMKRTTKTADGTTVDAKGAAALGISEAELQHEQEVRRERRIREVIRALAALTTPSSLTAEKEEFLSLVKSEVDRLNHEVCERGSPQLLFSGGLQVERPEAKAAESSQAAPGLQVLTTRVDALLSSLQKEIETADEKLQGKLRLLDLDGDGRISRTELMSALDLMQEKLAPEEVDTLMDRLGATGPDGSVEVAELMRISREMLEDAAEEKEKI